MTHFLLRVNNNDETINLMISYLANLYLNFIRLTKLLELYIIKLSFITSEYDS